MILLVSILESYAIRSSQSIPKSVQRSLLFLPGFLGGIGLESPSSSSQSPAGIPPIIVHFSFFDLILNLQQIIFLLL
jgi:hypothetical protein